MRKKKFSVLGGRSWISGLHRYLFVAALIWAWQVIALDRANVYKNNTLSLGDTVRSPEPLLPVSDPVDFEATAYCDFGITKSGARTIPGIAAADPSVLPLGSLVFLENSNYRGVFRILDTGRLVKGKIIDIYMTRYVDAVNFGRQPVKVSVLQIGDPEPAALQASN
jgi:3D (Asp-Asp-Asp) domain-containing protein